MVRLSQLDLSQFVSLKARYSEQNIELKRFINFDLDTFGWYALGHYDNEKFIAIVDQREALRTPSYKIRRVWARLEDNELQETTFFSPKAEPATILEFYA